MSKSGRPSQSDQHEKLASMVAAILGGGIKDGRIIDSSAVMQMLEVSKARACTLIADLKRFLAVVQPAATGIEVAGDSIFYYRSQLWEHTAEKEEVARKVAELLEESRCRTVACGPGTTVATAVRGAIERRPMTVLTNSCGVLEQVGHMKAATLEFAGGTYMPTIHACIGDSVINTFARSHCAAAIIGVSGVNAEGHLFVNHRYEVPVLEQILESTTEAVYVVTSGAKLAQVDMWSFASLDDLTERGLSVHLVTNPIDDCQFNSDRERARAEMVYDALGKYMQGEAHPANPRTPRARP